MRERLVAAFVGLTIVVVALFGIPRAYFLADLIRDQEQDRLDRTAELVAAVISERHAHHGEVDTAYLDGLIDEGEGIRFVPADGPVIGTSRWSDPAGGDISTLAEVEGGGTLTVVRDRKEVDDAVAQALLPVVLLGLFLILLAGSAGYLLARRIARPFRELASAARGLGTGQLRVDLPDYRVPEAREIARALASSGEKIEALIHHEREVTVHASHELRTPLTALRLDLEDLALWPQTPPDVVAELHRSIGELDRLDRAVGQLLTSSHDRSAESAIDLDLDALVADTVARIARDGHQVAHSPAGRLPTRLDPQPVVEALELLLVGGCAVSESDRGTHLEILISGGDWSTSPDPRDAAAELVAAAGGRLARLDDDVLLRLPKRPVTTR